ncbi:MAG: HNH endonuclease [Thermoflexales bacterium]|nr:HNH endonuclease [Thermoflexales bacterium]
MQKVLVLNTTYEPLNTISVPRAVALLLEEKAELVEAAEAVLRSQHLVLPLPLVIRLRMYVRIPHRFRLSASRRSVLLRDRYTCQYCGHSLPASELTVDHVLPRSRGGTADWENVVAACKRCNHRKGNRTPGEARMTLLRKPYRPRYLALAVVTGARSVPPAWQHYLE